MMIQAKKTVDVERYLVIIDNMAKLLTATQLDELIFKLQLVRGDYNDRPENYYKEPPEKIVTGKGE
jgi:hypothetical protein